MDYVNVPIPAGMAALFCALTEGDPGGLRSEVYLACQARLEACGISGMDQFLLEVGQSTVPALLPAARRSEVVLLNLKEYAERQVSHWQRTLADVTDELFQIPKQTDGR